MKFTATIVDEDQAGRPFPVRPITENGQLVRWDHQLAAAYLTEVRLFWADVAAQNMCLYDAGCVEALHDVREALGNAGPIPAREEPPLTARHIFNACEATGPMPADALAELDVDTLFSLQAMYREKDLGMGGQFAQERRAVDAECQIRMDKLAASLTGE